MTNQNREFDLQQRLLDKSLEAYILALETINRLTIQYRVETFCFLFCNAWELLLKAKILTASGNDDSIYYPNRQGGTRRTLSLRDSLNRLVPKPQDPMRRNLQRIVELRDESVHLTIDRIPVDVMCLFQAGVVNYHRQLNRWFGRSLSNRVSVGMMSIVYDRSPEQWDMANSQLRQQYGQETFTYLAEYCAKLKGDFEQSQRSTEFSIGIEYRLVLTKRQDDGDIMLAGGSTDCEPTQVVHVARDSSETHPHRQLELLQRIKSELPELRVNQHDIYCINKVYGIKSNPAYFYQGKVRGSPGQYSESYAEWVIGRFRQDDQFFQLTREKAKEKGR